MTLSTLQQRAHTHIQKALALPVKLRESFSCEEQNAHFILRVAVNKGNWQDLLELNGARLKPLKRQAYQTALEMAVEELRKKTASARLIIIQSLVCVTVSTDSTD